jgi:UPF0716 protein FxsA
MTDTTDARFDRSNLFKVILLLLVYSLIPLGEIILFVYLGNVIGNYLILVVAAVAGLPGAIIILSQMRRLLITRRRLGEGRAAAAGYVDLLGLCAGALLLITPGFVTDVCGYLLFIPGVRKAAGKLIAHRLPAGFKEIGDALGLLSL